MVGNFLLVGEELKRHIPWAWGTSRDKPKGIISIGYVALPAGMSIDDFGVVEFLRFDNREGDQFLTRDADGVMKPECMTGTVMRTEFKGNVVVPPRRPGGSATIVSMCDIPAFRLEAAKASPCDRVARSDKALTDKLWKAVEGLPWQRTNMEKRPALGDPDAYSADGQSLVKPPVVNPPRRPASGWPGTAQKVPVQVDERGPTGHAVVFVPHYNNATKELERSGGIYAHAADAGFASVMMRNDSDRDLLVPRHTFVGFFECLDPKTLFTSRARYLSRGFGDFVFP